MQSCLPRSLAGTEQRHDTLDRLMSIVHCTFPCCVIQEHKAILEHGRTLRASPHTLFDNLDGSHGPVQACPLYLAFLCCSAAKGVTMCKLSNEQ